jgi:two-component system sensor histidine kinase BaeS
MTPRSLRMQLLGATLLVVLLCSVITIAVAGLLTRRTADRAVLQDVSQQADLIAGRERVALLPLGHLDTLRTFLARQNERAVVAPLDRPSPYLPGDSATRLRVGQQVDGTLTADGRSWFFAARNVTGKGFVLLRPRVVGTAAWKPYLEGLLIASAVAGLIAAGVSFLLARRIARPLRRLAEATRRVAAGQSVDVPPEGATELASLAESFNEMAAQLEHARDAERAFLLSVSHELKTPLTAIRGYAEGLHEGVLPPGDAAATIVGESRRLERLVGDLLDLARMNKAEFSVRREPIDLAEIGPEAVRRYEGQARDFDVTLELVAPEEAPAIGDADRVLQIVSNLVENALRLAPSGGTVRIVAAPGELRVEDTGPGLKAEELERAFERFYLYSRYGRQRPVGTGLGLAIVKELAEGMGGSVAASSEPGALTVFTVRLPLPTPGREPADATLTPA